MALNFPNESRSYNARSNLVQFWGHDGALEIPFFIEASALYKLCPQTGYAETGYLRSFDSARDHIHEAARKVYRRGGKSVYVLSSADFARETKHFDVKTDRPQSKETT